jgi:membrane protein
VKSHRSANGDGGGPATAVASAVGAYALARTVGALASSPPHHDPEAQGDELRERRAQLGPRDEVAADDPTDDRLRALEPGRGREADRPGKVPARGWKDVAYRVSKEVKDDNVPLLSAGVAFYALLALFPASAAVVSIYGLVADPADVSKQLSAVDRVLPKDVADLILNQLRTAAGASSRSLGITAVIGIVAALWSASSGMKWLMAGLDAVYDERETRKFVRLRGTALFLTFGAAFALAITLVLLSAVGALGRVLGLGSAGTTVVAVLRWPALGALMIVGLAALYRMGPDRDAPRWRWVSWGAVTATVIWLVASIGLAIYASLASSFQQSYGALAGVVVLMLWLFLSALAVLVGGEVNSELERQTARDTTVGPSRALGQRDAEAADTVGVAAPAR